MMGNDDVARVIASTHSILLDFDGPVTPLFPGRDGAELANTARRVLTLAGINLPRPYAATTDHLAVLRYGARIASRDVLNELEAACLHGEVDAAMRTEPTPGAHRTLEAAQDAGRPVVIVSNNAGAAVDAYLKRNRLGSLVRSIVGREPGRPDLMKPNVEPINRALLALQVGPESCVFIGDSVTDVEVSRRTRIRSIGYAKTSERGDELVAAGADAITDDMRLIANAIGGR